MQRLNVSDYLKGTRFNDMKLNRNVEQCCIQLVREQLKTIFDKSLSLGIGMMECFDVNC